MSAEDLKRALIALYGERGWQTSAALDLGRDVSSVRRWTSGQIPVPGPVAQAIRVMLDQAKLPG